MRGYGRDYEDRNFLERAGNTVRRWFGGSDYDRDFGRDRDWDRGGMNRGYSGRSWSRGYDRDFGNQGGLGGGWRGRDWDEDRDLGNRGWSGRGMGGGYNGRGMGMDRDLDRGGLDRGGMMSRGGMNRGWSGGMPRMGGGSRGFTGDQGMWGRGYGDSRDVGNEWGDYNRSGYGGDAFRSTNAGGVEPGRHFRGYGHGSRHHYEPY
jgi:hypothetical protein